MNLLFNTEENKEFCSYVYFPTISSHYPKIVISLYDCGGSHWKLVVALLIQPNNNLDTLTASNFLSPTHPGIGSLLCTAASRATY
jgi:hypothetical protein